MEPFFKKCIPSRVRTKKSQTKTHIYSYFNCINYTRWKNLESFKVHFMSKWCLLSLCKLKIKSKIICEMKIKRNGWRMNWIFEIDERKDMISCIFQENLIFCGWFHALNYHVNSNSHALTSTTHFVFTALNTNKSGSNLSWARLTDKCKFSCFKISRRFHLPNDLCNDVNSWIRLTRTKHRFKNVFDVKLH